MFEIIVAVIGLIVIVSALKGLFILMREVGILVLKAIAWILEHVVVRAIAFMLRPITRTERYRKFEAQCAIDDAQRKAKQHQETIEWERKEKIKADEEAARLALERSYGPANTYNYWP